MGTQITTLPASIHSMQYYLDAASRATANTLDGTPGSHHDVEVKQGILGRWRTYTIQPTSLYYIRFNDVMCLLGVLSLWFIIFQVC